MKNQMPFANVFLGREEFLEVNSWKRVFASMFIAVVGFALTFFVVHAFGLRFHFFQYSIILNALMFGPFAGLVTGALVSSYNALFIVHNPFIIGGNALLGLLVALFAKRLKPFFAVLAAYAIQVPYLLVTDLAVGMKLGFVLSIIVVLALENAVCAVLAGKSKNPLKKLLG